MVIHEQGIDYDIHHEQDCPTEEYAAGLPGDGPILHHTCNVGHMLSEVGLDALDVDWTKLKPGTYRIEFWSHEHPAIPGIRPAEHDVGLHIVWPTLVEDFLGIIDGYYAGSDACSRVEAALAMLDTMSGTISRADDPGMIHVRVTKDSYDEWLRVQDHASQP